MISFDNVHKDSELSNLFLPCDVAEEISWHLKQDGIEHEIHRLYIRNKNFSRNDPMQNRLSDRFIKNEKFSEYSEEEIDEIMSVFEGYSDNAYYPYYVNVLVSRIDSMELTKIAINIYEGSSDPDYEKYIKVNDEHGWELHLLNYAEPDDFNNQPPEKKVDYEKTVNESITSEDVKNIRYNAGQTNDTEAKYYMGILYENGYGVPQDLERAYVWYLIARKFGYKVEAEKLERFMDKLEVERLEKAKGFMDNIDDCENIFSEFDEDDDKIEEFKSKKQNNNSKLKEKTIMDLIMEYGESIKKNQMTSFHLLYGYACICLMRIEDICRELNVKEEDSERIAYCKYQFQKKFNNNQIEMNPKRLKILISQSIGQLEQDKTAIEVYKTALMYLDSWKSYSIESVATGILNQILLNKDEFHCNTVNMEYLKDNKLFIPEKKDSMEAEDAWSLEHIAKQSNSMYDFLLQKIHGQDMAVQKFVQGYTNSNLAGQSRKNKPAATFLFAGPPGVGKTYLSQLFAEQTKMPIKVFDMSEYAEHNSINGLIGFEKSYKEARGGTLTTFVDENPTSILLIDEIEKAHHSIQLLFLQVLEGARLNDKYFEKDVRFEDVIIIFTTNSGRNLYENNEEANLSALEESEILQSLREDREFPPELCSRLASGNIIMFNHLQPYELTNIVRDKIDGVISDFQNNHKLHIEYDSLLPELFLFHVGAGCDARVVSAQSGEIIKDSVISLVKEEVGNRGSFTAENISINIKLDRESPVYPILIDKKDNEILVVSEHPGLAFRHPMIKVRFAKDENEMLQIIREHSISFAIIDLEYKVKEQQKKISNALGSESVGMTCFEMIRQKAPQLPVYILDQESYHEEDKKAISIAGARGIFPVSIMKDKCEESVKKLLEQLYIQKNLKLLRQKGQRIDYKTRYLLDVDRAVIELYDLSLKTDGSDDAALRRKASQSKVFDFERPALRFEHIIGAEQAKRDFRHFINYIHNIDKYILEGAEIPKGVILYGPPGTGKTSLAKAFAGECDAIFLSTTGANIQNSANPVQEIKDLFKIAYTQAPAILFIDEIDVIAKERQGNDTRAELLVNTLLTEMEGFGDKDPFKPVFVVAATNYNVEHSNDRPGEIVIDPALVRRFDNPIYIGLPSRQERKQYVQMLLEQRKYSDRISEIAVDYVAEHTGGRSLAFLKRFISNMTNVAIDLRKEICDDLLTDTLETQLFGEKRENDDAYRLSVARHEAGHAYVSWKTGKEPKFITIVSRGNFGGYVSYGDGEDIHNMTKEDYLNCICRVLAGRAAEIIYYKEKGINTGSSSDLEKATKYVIQMICYLGMGKQGLVSMNPERVLESSKGGIVLEEANQVLEEQMERAMDIIRKGQQTIDRVVEVLMDKSYIQGENLTAILEIGDQVIESISGEKDAKKNKWYVVINGRKPGVYTTWTECEEQVKGYSNAIYRSYRTKEEAYKIYQSSRIGVKNIQDQPLLYHLVKLNEVETYFKNGLCPTKQIGAKKYFSFEFYPYAPNILAVQKAHPEDTYVYFCISRERAEELGFQILIQDPKKQSQNLYSYKNGYSKIDWKSMEQIDHENHQQEIIQCVSDTVLAYDEIQNIYVPDDETVEKIVKLSQKYGKNGKKISINVNRRMFL
jgi:ATP-dependent Zn protease